MAFSNTSRYLLTDVVEVRNPFTNKLTEKPFVDLLDRVTTTAFDDQGILYDTVDDWAGVAFRYLGDAKAWWVIADLSDVIDPFSELEEGKQLRAPSLSRYQLSVLPTNSGSF